MPNCGLSIPAPIFHLVAQTFAELVKFKEAAPLPCLDLIQWRQRLGGNSLLRLKWFKESAYRHDQCSISHALYPEFQFSLLLPHAECLCAVCRALVYLKCADRKRIYIPACAAQEHIVCRLCNVQRLRILLHDLI